VRGASFNNEARNLRAANRNRNEPGNSNNNIGFRCVRDVERKGRRPFCEAGASQVTAEPGVPFHFRAARLTRTPWCGDGVEQQKRSGPVVA
jgi:hypothetical protein